MKWCAWTADSKSLVVVGRSAPGARAALFLVSLETREKRRLTDPPPESEDFNPAVSPNGRTLAFSRGNAFNRADLYLLSLSEDGGRRENRKGLPSTVRLNLFQPGPQTDGNSCSFLLIQLPTSSLWRIAVIQFCTAAATRLYRTLESGRFPPGESVGLFDLERGYKHLAGRCFDLPRESPGGH